METFEDLLVMDDKIGQQVLFSTF